MRPEELCGGVGDAKGGDAPSPLRRGMVLMARLAAVLRLRMASEDKGGIALLHAQVGAVVPWGGCACSRHG